ncbi:MAG TPA: hypothetical protein PKW80_09955 [Bacteroidales bacterium]|nr:hypothetical protein [Bacteroidales bacterium]
MTLLAGKNNNNWDNFIEDYGKQFEDVKNILKYSHTYPEVIALSEIFGSINDDLTANQKEWVWLNSKFTHQEEIDFFRPHWVPLYGRQGIYDYFIDLSHERYMVTGATYINCVDPYYWYKADLFNLKDFILQLDNETFDFKGFFEYQQNFYGRKFELIIKEENERDLEDASDE